MITLCLGPWLSAEWEVAKRYGGHNLYNLLSELPPADLGEIGHFQAAERDCKSKLSTATQPYDSGDEDWVRRL